MPMYAVLRCVIISIAIFAFKASAQHDLAKDDDDFEPGEVPEGHSVEREVKAPPPKAPEKVAEPKVEKPPPTPTEQPQKPKTATPTVDRLGEIKKPPQPPDLFRDHWMEMAAGVILLIYLLTCIRGKTVNSGIAQAFQKDCIEVYKQNFHQVGEKDDEQMVQEGFSNYRLYATGRAHCNFCLTYLDLAKRQDPCSAYILSFHFPWEDIVRLEIPMDNVDNFNFCLFRRASQKAANQSSTDLAAFGRVRKVDDLPSKDFTVMTDCAEVTTPILSQSVLKTIKAHDKCVNRIRISDSMQGSPSVKKGIIAEFRLPKKLDDMDQIANLIRMTMHLVDCVSQLKLTEKARTAIVEARREAQKTSDADLRLQREQRMQEKKIAKKKEEEQAWEKLTPEQQRKKEEQAYKKSLKKRMPGMKMMKG